MSHLHIRDLQMSDFGTYLCIATNEFGAKEVALQLKSKYSSRTDCCPFMQETRLGMNERTMILRLQMRFAVRSLRARAISSAGNA